MSSSARDARILSLSDELHRLDPELNSIVDSVSDDVDDDDNDSNAPATLNVSEPDSPYALIDRFFPERGTLYKRQSHEFERRYSKGHLSKGQLKSIGGLKPREVS